MARHSTIWRGVELQQVLAAQHVGDLHERVVDGVDERVQRDAVAAHDDVVGDRAGREGHLAADEVGDGDVLVGHAHTDHGLAPLGAVRRLLRRRSGRGRSRRNRAWGRGRRHGAAPRPPRASRRTRTRSRPRAAGAPRRRACRGARDWRYGPYGPPMSGPSSYVMPEPGHRVEQLVVALLGVALGVGVLDAEHEVAARVARVRPVEQGRAHHAHVRRAGGRRAESNANLCHVSLSLAWALSRAATRGCAACRCLRCRSRRSRRGAAWSRRRGCP